MRQKIEIIRGTSNTFNIAVTDADGNPYTMADGDQIIFGVKEKPEAETLLVRKIALECTDGVCTIELDPLDTLGLAYGRYVYDVGLETGFDYYNIIEASPFYIAPNVTRWGDSA